MGDEQFVEKYEELLSKGYCDCNEMNCIDNNSPRRILNIVKNLQQENQELKKPLEAKESQQKEFIECLEKEIVDSRAGSCQQYYAQNHLRLYKEIIGKDINVATKEM